MHIVGLLLAAGFSRRFGVTNKLAHLLPDGRPIALAAAQNLVAALPNSIAVIREEDHALGEILSKAGLQIAGCTADQQEMADSLAAAMRFSAGAAPMGFVIALGDMPYINSATIKNVANSLAIGASIVVPTYQDPISGYIQRGHPVGFAAKFRQQLENLQGDVGAKAILRQHQDEITFLPCDDAGILMDIDTLADIPPDITSG